MSKTLPNNQFQQKIDERLLRLLNYEICIDCIIEILKDTFTEIMDKRTMSFSYERGKYLENRIKELPILEKGESPPRKDNELIQEYRQYLTAQALINTLSILEFLGKSNPNHESRSYLRESRVDCLFRRDQRETLLEDATSHRVILHLLQAIEGECDILDFSLFVNKSVLYQQKYGILSKEEYSQALLDFLVSKFSLTHVLKEEKIQQILLDFTDPLKFAQIVEELRHRIVFKRGKDHPEEEIDAREFMSYVKTHKIEWPLKNEKEALKILIAFKDNLNLEERE